MNLHDGADFGDGVLRKIPSKSTRKTLTSTTRTEMAERSFTNYWTIEQFLVQQELHNFSEFIVAPKFGDDDYEFALKLFPNGKDEETVGFLSLFLLINKCPYPRLRFRVSFTVETTDGPRNCALNKNLVTINRAGIVTASKFFSADLLKTSPSRYLPNDALTIGVDLTVFGEAVTITNNDIYGPSSKIARLSTDVTPVKSKDAGFLELLDSGDLSDFMIISKCGRIFRVHKCVLAARSEYFAAMFRTAGTKEAINNEVRFNDLSGAVINIIIRHIYSPESTISGLTDSDINEELILATDRLMIDSLKKELFRTITMNVTVDNIVNRIVLADMVDESLFNQLLFFFSNHRVLCTKTEEWEELKKTNPSLVAKVLEALLFKTEERY